MGVGVGVGELPVGGQGFEIFLFGGFRLLFVDLRKKSIV